MNRIPVGTVIGVGAGLAGAAILLALIVNQGWFSSLQGGASRIQHVVGAGRRIR